MGLRPEEPMPIRVRARNVVGPSFWNMAAPNPMVTTMPVGAGDSSSPFPVPSEGIPFISKFGSACFPLSPFSCTHTHAGAPSVDYLHTNYIIRRASVQQALVGMVPDMYPFSDGADGATCLGGNLYSSSAVLLFSLPLFLLSSVVHAGI